MPDIAEGVRAIITEVLGCPPALVTADAGMSEGLGAKTLDRIDIALEIESDFGIVICGPAYLDCVTVGDVSTFVEGRLRAMGKLS